MRHPDDAAAERAVGHGQCGDRVENEVRVEELRVATPGSEVVEVAIERVELAEHDAKLFGEQLDVGHRGECECNVLIERALQGEEAIEVNGQYGSGDVIDRLTVSRLAGGTEAGAAWKGNPSYGSSTRSNGEITR